MSAPAEVQAATLDKFIKGWSGWTPDGFLATWSDDCAQVTLPFNSGVGPRHRKHTEHIFPILMSIVTNFELKVHNVVHDPAQGKAVIYAITDANSPFGPYHNEHAVFIWFDETGEKVVKIEEMFDQIFMNEFLPKFQKYVAEHAPEPLPE